MSILTVERKVLEKNDEIASRNRALFAKKGLFVVNVVSSPGSGKTSLLERTFTHLRGKIPLAVVEGDVQTDLDAQRVARYDVPVVQIVTNGGCHLEARLVEDALSALPLDKIKLLFIENVGNLVCPSNYDLGEHMKIVVASTTEGDDKPLKYPGMFHKASVLVINKIDLVPYVNSRPEVLKANALKINPSLKVFETSCTTDAGIPEWCEWIEEQISPGKPQKS
jgi:hydrogenase nickel incorporation protein HypB